MTLQPENFSFKQRFLYFFPALFCFFLSFGFLFLSVIILGWLIASFFNLNKEKISATIKSYDFLILVGFFILTCLSAVFSKNKTEALSAIEIKFSFIVFPYLIFCHSWSIEILKRCISSFVSGTFFTCLVLLIRATVFTYQGKEDYFFYTSFSYFIHPSYFSMYLILAICFIILFYPKWFSAQKNILYTSYFFAFVFLICTFLCSSKMGLISLFLCLPIILIHKLKIKTSLKNITFFLTVLILVFLISSKLFPSSFDRLKSISQTDFTKIDKASTESTGVRILIWEQAIKIIGNHFVFGTGVGDANGALYEAYKTNGMIGAYDHHLNAHNQYLQTFIGMGIIGLLVLLLITFGEFTRSVLSKNVLLSVFLIMIIINFSVESMLQTAAGVLFFVFFFCLLKSNDFKRLSE